MRLLLSLVLYIALALGANADTSGLADLRAGDMRKLTVHPEVWEVSARPFLTQDGSEMTLQDYEGKFILLNFWATWCAPCRHEMPTLSELETLYGGDTFKVVTVATGRNKPQAMEKFFQDIGVDNLPLHRDPTQGLARDMAVLGLPVTVIIDPQGDEIARLRGDANWSSPEARAVIEALIASHQP